MFCFLAALFLDRVLAGVFRKRSNVEGEVSISPPKLSDNSFRRLTRFLTKSQKFALSIYKRSGSRILNSKISTNLSYLRQLYTKDLRFRATSVEQIRGMGEEGSNFTA